MYGQPQLLDAKPGTHLSPLRSKPFQQLLLRGRRGCFQRDIVQIFYSGDYTSESLLLEDDSPALVNKPSSMLLDLAIVDAAYGTDTNSQADKLEQLEQKIDFHFLNTITPISWI